MYLLTMVSSAFRLEDTLIDLYLSNYNLAANSAASVTTSFETEESENFKFPSDGLSQIFFVQKMM